MVGLRSACERPGQVEFIRVVPSAERSRNASDADQRAFGVGEMPDDKAVG